MMDNRVRIHYSFVVDTCYFDWEHKKHIEIKNHLLNDLYSQFYDLIDRNNNKNRKIIYIEVQKFKNWFTGNNNTLIFYTGVESKYKNTKEKYKEDIYDKYPFLKNNNIDLLDNKNTNNKVKNYIHIYNIKTPIPNSGDKSKRLLSVLLEIVTPMINKVSIAYIMFPILFDNLHQK